MIISPLLCLACASSIIKPSFTTKCCSRPICDNCLSRNPRLKAYDPCLRCFNGVEAVSHPQKHLGSNGRSDRQVNDVVEEDMFTIGDEEDDDDAKEEGDAPPPYPHSSPSSGSLSSSSSVRSSSLPPPPQPVSTPSDASARPSRHYIRPGDTLAGIALKYRIDSRKLAKTNNLPISTLSTTPHLLHTRQYVSIPQRGQSNGSSLIPATSEPAPEVEERRTRERAAKRFAFVTKETDYHVAKTYVALAEGEGSSSIKNKHEAVGELRQRTKVSGEGLESQAVDSYLDDEEWEQEERRAGRDPKIQGFPYFAGSKGSSSSSKWTSWMSGKK